MNNRLQHLREALAENEIDGIFISQAENRSYLSGFHGSAGFLFITEKTAILATDFRYTEQAVSQAPDFEILRIGAGLGDWFAGMVSEHRVKRLGFESSDVSYLFHSMLTSALEKKSVDTELVPGCGGGGKPLPRPGTGQRGRPPGREPSPPAPARPPPPPA